MKPFAYRRVSGVTEAVAFPGTEPEQAVQAGGNSLLDPMRIAAQRLAAQTGGGPPTPPAGGKALDASPGTSEAPSGSKRSGARESLVRTLPHQD